MTASKAKPKKTNAAAKHVRFYRWLLDSPAYRSLSPTARCLLVELYSFYSGSNNGWVFLSVRDAAQRLGVGSSTAARAYVDLEDRGFIRPRVKGGFNVNDRRATEWVLTEFALGDNLATKDFMSWRPRK